MLWQQALLFPQHISKLGTLRLDEPGKLRVEEVGAGKGGMLPVVKRGPRDLLPVLCAFECVCACVRACACVLCVCLCVLQGREGREGGRRGAADRTPRRVQAPALRCGPSLPGPMPPCPLPARATLPALQQDPEHWRAILRRLHCRPEQLRKIVAGHQRYLDRMRPVMEERQGGPARRLLFPCLPLAGQGPLGVCHAAGWQHMPACTAEAAAAGEAAPTGRPPARCLPGCGCRPCRPAAAADAVADALARFPVSPRRARMACRGAGRGAPYDGVSDG